MTDLGELVNQSNVEHAINTTTIILALIEKGILTTEELEAARARATAIVDQLWAEKRRAAEEEWRREHPQTADAMGLLSKLMGVTPPSA